MTLRSLLRTFASALAMLVALGVSPSSAQTAQGGSAASGGWVVQANPWRTPDGLAVRVDYMVQLAEGATAAPGMLLTAWRQSRIGRVEGPPLVKVGYLTVIAAEGNLAVARAVPLRGGPGPHLEVPVVVVGDLVRPERDVRAWGAAGSSVELNRVFPAGDGVPGPEADRVLGELVKPLGAAPDQVVVVVYDSPAAAGASRAPGVAFEQAAAVAQRVAKLLSLDEGSVHAVAVPMPEGGRPVLELRVSPRVAAGSKPERPGAS